MLPTESLLSDFPILDQPINGQPLVYLDNAATTQKPMAVLLASRHYYEAINSNIHRGTHQLARFATESLRKSPPDRRQPPQRRHPPTRSSSPPAPPAASTSPPTSSAFPENRPRRRDPHFHPRTPLEHRPVADALPAHRSHAQGDPLPRRRHARSGRLPIACSPRET